MAMVAMSETASFEDSMGLRGSPAALRARAEVDGYLYFRGLLDPAEVINVRRQVLELCSKHGWVDPAAPLMEGIASGQVRVCEGNDPRWIAFYKDVLRLHDFHELAMRRAILNTLSDLFGEQAITHSRNICRVMFPSTAEYTTPPHQDHLYIGGTQETWTSWIPLGDCPPELGGLALLPGSHGLGFMKSKPGKGAGGQQVEVPEDAVWVIGPMNCGDALFFNSLTIHQGRDNVTDDRLRLSVDYRYQPISHPLRRDSMEPHMAGFGQGWEDIYAEWPADDPLKYYWRKWDLNYVER